MGVNKLNNNFPLVSIIMNCHNGQKYLKEAIDSVISQTYKNWELIFWDNLSTDNSSEIVKNYNDIRIKYYRSSNFNTLYASRNLALKKCSGKYIAFLDVDDIWSNEKLEIQIPYFYNDNVGIVCSKYVIFDEKTRKEKKYPSGNKKSGKIVNDLLKNYDIGLLTLVVRHEAIKKHQIYFDDRFDIVGDTAFVLNLAFECEVFYINSVLAKYRLHDGNLGAKDRLKNIRELELLIIDMSANSNITKYSGYRKMCNQLKYLNGVDSYYKKNNKDLINSIKSLNLSIYKFKLIVGLIKNIIK